MKSKIVQELLELFEPDRVIDQPRKFTKAEVEIFVDIAELEIMKEVELLEEKVSELKSRGWILS